MPLATIKIAAFTYTEIVHDADEDRHVRQERVARRGETVELSPTELERARRYNAIEEETS